MLYCFTKHGRDFTATTEGAKKALKGEAEHANSEVWGSFWLFVCKKYKQWTSHGEKVKGCNKESGVAYAAAHSVIWRA